MRARCEASDRSSRDPSRSSASRRCWPSGLRAGAGGGFVHDDHRQIVGNPLVQNLSQVPLLFTTGVWAGTGSGSSWYRPLMMASFALDRALLGPAALGSHAVSLLLFAISRGARGPLHAVFGAPWPVALLAGALGAVHPAQAEPVAWISARCDLLLAAFGFGALLLYQRASRAWPLGFAGRARRISRR